MSAPTGTTTLKFGSRFSSADIDGLATEAATLEELRDKVLSMVAELAELNGLSRSTRNAGALPCGANGSHPKPELRLMPSFEKEVRQILAEYGCAFHRQGKGDHEIWFSPISKRLIARDVSFSWGI